MLTYDAPAGWVASPPPRELPPDSALQCISAFRPPDEPDVGASLALYTLTAPRSLYYPATAEERVEVVSGLIDAPTFRAWRRVEGATLAGAPGIRATADTTRGLTHIWAIFGRRKLFMLELVTPADGPAEADALGESVLATVRLK